MKFYLTLFSLLLLPLSAYSATPEVHVVNMQAVIDQSVAGKAARSSLEKEVAKRRAKIEKMKGDVAAYERSVNKQKSLLSEEALIQKAEDLRKRKVELSRVIADETEYIERSKGTTLKKMVEQVEKLLPKLAKEKGVSIVVESDPRLVVYVNPKYDLTDDLIEMLNKSSISF